MPIQTRGVVAMFNRNTIWVEFDYETTVWFGGWKNSMMERFGGPTTLEMKGVYTPRCKFEILSRQMDRW